MPSTVENLTVAKLMLRLFQGRADRILIDDGLGNVSNRTPLNPLSVVDIAEGHLVGAVGYGVFPLFCDGTIHFAAVDFDNKPGNPNPKYRENAARVASALEHAGLKPLVEISQSGRGVHVWIFFEKPMEAVLVRRLLNGLLSQLDLINTEVFPKQDKLTARTKFGNAIRLPLYNKSRFVDPSAGWKTLAPLETLRGAHRVTAVELRAAAELLGIDLDPIPQNPHRIPATSRAPGAISADGLSSYVQQLLSRKSTLARRWNSDSDGLKDPSRSGVAMSIACCLVRAYVPTEEIVTTLRLWCRESNYTKGERDEWIFLTVEKAYQFVQTSTLRSEEPERKHESAAIDREFSRAKRRQGKRR